MSKKPITPTSSTSFNLTQDIPLFSVFRKGNGELLSANLTQHEVDYLLIEKKWPKEEITILPAEALINPKPKKPNTPRPGQASYLLSTICQYGC